MYTTRSLFKVAALLIALLSVPLRGETELTRLTDPVAGSLHQGRTTLADQSDVAVTVYNNNRALVRDRRSISLLPGESALRFMDVSAALMPESVSLRSVNDPGALRILEQNYEYDLISPEKLLEKYVGREVTLINKSNDFSFYDQKATLLSMNNGPVYEIEGNIFLGHPGVVSLPELPEELYAKPTLIWLLANEGTDHEIEASYLTHGLNWRADYVLSLDRAETSADIEGWVTLENSSGATYANAQLKLVAGEVNMVAPETMRDSRKLMAMADMAAGAPPMMEQEAFAEFHLYTLQRRTTINNNQTKQVSLLSGSDMALQKKYEFRGGSFYYSSVMQRQQSQSADVFILFDNREENGLGMPLPAGIVRIYQEDSSGMLQFAGEDRIRHTPRNETVRLAQGKAFDVVGDRTQTDFRTVAQNTHESSYTVSIRNRKTVPVTVDVIEPMSGTWRILEESHPHVKPDAHTAVYSLEVPADGEVELKYRIRVGY